MADLHSFCCLFLPALYRKSPGKRKYHFDWASKSGAPQSNFFSAALRGIASSLLLASFKLSSSWTPLAGLLHSLPGFADVRGCSRHSFLHHYVCRRRAQTVILRLAFTRREMLLGSKQRHSGVMLRGAAPPAAVILFWS